MLEAVISLFLLYNKRRESKVDGHAVLVIYTLILGHPIQYFCKLKKETKIVKGERRKV